MVKGETTNCLTDYKAWEVGKTDDESCGGSAKRGVCGTSTGRSSLRSPSRRPSAMIDPRAHAIAERSFSMVAYLTFWGNTLRLAKATGCSSQHWRSINMMEVASRNGNWTTFTEIGN